GNYTACGSTSKLYFSGTSLACAADDTGTASGWTTSGNYVYNSTAAANVGIGTATPGEKLEVNGSIKYGDSIYNAYGWSPTSENLVPDPYFSDMTEWTGEINYSVEVQQLPTGDYVQVLAINASGNIQIRSNYIPVDNWKTYRASIWVKSDNDTDGTRYLGLYCYNAAKATTNCTVTAGTNTSNFYFWTGDVPLNVWYKKTAYIFGLNTSTGWTNPADTSSANVKFNEDVAYIAIRFLNYYSNATTNWFALPTIEEVKNNERVWSVVNNATVLSNGMNVGIGTTVPADKLSVVGTVNATDFECSAGDCIGAAEINSTSLASECSTITGSADLCDDDDTCSTAACTVASDDTLTSPIVGGDLSMANYIITNIGNANTDFTSDGGLTLNGNLSTLGTSNTISGNTSFDGGTLFVNSARNYVGVGNTMPNTTLEVTGNSRISRVDASTLLTIINTNSTASRTPYLIISNYQGSVGGGYPAMYFQNAQGDESSPLALDANNYTGIIAFRAYNGTNFVSTSYIMGRVSSTFTGGDHDGILVFYTANGTSGSPAERMRINENGDMGLATTTPDARIEAVKTDGAQLRLSYNDDSVYTDFTTDSSGNMAISPTGGKVGIETTNPADTLTVAGTLNATNIQLNVNCADGEILKWASGVGTCGSDSTVGGSGWATSGNYVYNSTAAALVGIGTASPTAKLDVVGTVRATSQTVPASGSGAELIYTGGNSYLYSYNRSASVFLPLYLDGSKIILGSGSGGNVGIGTTVPSEKLTVIGDLNITSASDVSTTLGTGALYITTGSAGIGFDIDEIQSWGTDLYLQYDDVQGINIGNGDLVVNTSANNVGIRTTAPELATHIVGALGFPATSGTAQTGVLRLQGVGSNGVLDISVNGGSGAAFQATARTDLSAYYGLWLNPNGGAVGIGTTTNTMSGAVGKLAIAATDGTTALLIGNTTNAGRFALNIAGAGAGGYWTLYDYNGTWNAGITQKDGRVGIGTVSPATNFHVKGTTDVATIQAANAAGNKFLSFDYADGGASEYGNIQIQASALVLQSNYTNNINLSLNPLGGKVGIGTTEPSQLLTVDGIARFRQSGSTRYRSDHIVTGGTTVINSYDDTGAAYIPITIRGSDVIIWLG
ncbi:MAG: hypothetical protein NTU57_04945, partial [Candidatus Aenigmarchaeota archaeon]|nr:hypothetical protein [Candidatus Aenigmarchaeota archaeon]